MRYLTLASFNTYGGVLDLYSLTSRYRAITNYFTNSAVGIINFQEVFTYYHLFLLKKLLKNYPFCIFEKSLFGPKGGLVIFSKYPLKKIRYESFIRNFIPFSLRSSLELLTQRGALVVKIEEFNLVLLNTHLTAVQNNNWSRDSIYFNELDNEIKQFHKIVKIEAKRNNTLIASGDFNIAKGTDLYRELIDYPFLNDPFKKNTSPTRHQSFASPNRKTNCVDYFFIFGSSKFYKVSKSKYIFTNKIFGQSQKNGYVSDHIGLQILFEIPNF